MNVTVIPPEDPADVRERSGFDRRGTFFRGQHKRHPNFRSAQNAQGNLEDDQPLGPPVWRGVLDSPARKRYPEAL